MTQFFEPRKMRSPFTGETSMPTINSYDEGDRTYEQVIWTDPVTGHIIKKGLSSIKDKHSGKVIQDYKSEQNNSLNNQGYRS